ncbi:unnamed protein product [Caenorhabditis auriculariae]|uniref:GRIP domain-containing protein n=1 Tax=Caenorhabditis auriculariae TaxID=2777116 RepID=A0A8S1H5B8_9PELO|nr:unnamed protein product [Caenorhabditis auriculariae]
MTLPQTAIPEEELQETMEASMIFFDQEFEPKSAEASDWEAYSTPAGSASDLSSEKMPPHTLEDNPERTTSKDQLLSEKTPSDLRLKVEENVHDWLPRAMQQLRDENEHLRSQLEVFHMANIEELRNEIENLRKQLEEANHTIDEIEVEAEQQYTEMSSEIDELCEVVMKKDEEIANLKEKLAKMDLDDSKLKEDLETKRLAIQRHLEIVENLRDELEQQEKKIDDLTKEKDKAINEAKEAKQKNDDKETFLANEAQMSLEIEDLQRELNKQKLILNSTSVAKIADTFERRILDLENAVRERDVLIHKQNQILNNNRRSPTSSRPSPSYSSNLPSSTSSSESFPVNFDSKTRDTIYSFLLSDRHSQLANIYNIGRILELSSQEEQTLERHLSRDRFL